MKPSIPVPTRAGLLRLAGIIVLPATAIFPPSATAGGVLPEYQPNRTSYDLYRAYQRSEVLVRERYGQPVPWKYILFRPDRFDLETIRLAETARRMEGERYRYQTDFTTITQNRIALWRERALANRRELEGENLSIAQAKLAREMAEHFLDKIDNDFMRYGRTGATIDDALALVQALEDPGFYMTPTGRQYGPTVSILRAQAIIVDAYFSHADIFSVDAGDSPDRIVKLGARLALSARVNEFDDDHPASLRYRYLRSLTRRLDGSDPRATGVLSDHEVAARVAFLKSLSVLEKDAQLRAPLTFIANEDTVDYARAVSHRMNSLQVLKILHAVPFAGRPPRNEERGMSAVEAQKHIAGSYLDTAVDPALVNVDHVPTLVTFVSSRPGERNRALLAWAQANRRYHRIPDSFVYAVGEAANADAVRSSLSGLTESQRPAPTRILPRMRLYDALLR